MIVIQVVLFSKLGVITFVQARGAEGVKFFWGRIVKKALECPRRENPVCKNSVILTFLKSSLSSK